MSENVVEGTFGAAGETKFSDAAKPLIRPKDLVSQVFVEHMGSLVLFGSRDEIHQIANEQEFSLTYFDMPSTMDETVTISLRACRITAIFPSLTHEEYWAQRNVAEAKMLAQSRALSQRGGLSS